MKITGNGNSVQMDAYVKSARNNARSATTAAAAKSAGEAGGDKVAISQQAMEVRRAADIAAGLPEVRQEKVAEIRQQISQGTYSVNGEKVAMNMIKESLINTEA